jgi:hypothetical protein
MTRKAMARRIAEPCLTSQQRGEAPAPPQPEGLRGGSHKLPGTWRITDERELIPTDYG